ncbi:glucose/galactose MFS transporter [Chitinophaga sp. MM2321]|uniref:glucose/galactose MFS transporter n=1 Tax=Chitinophaga sp. MM2321 TaxID=3137178 RepID=UPI0032D5783E
MNNNRKKLVVPMLIIGTMYAVLGFSIGINAFFIPFVQEAFNISTAMSYLIMTATFSAYVVFGVPSGAIIKKVGYKGGITVAFLLIAAGFFVIGYAAQIVSFLLFLVALFVVGMGQTLLTGAINSYVTILGSPESAASRICMMGIADKLAFAGASLILARFMDLANIRLTDVIIPFYIITGLLIVMGIFAFFSPLPEIKAIGEDETSEDTIVSVYANSKTSIFQFPHLLLGIVAIFFDVGVEIIALGSINDYAAILKLPSPQHYVWYVSAGMVIGYLVGVSFIPRYLSQHKALILSTILGVVITLSIVLFPPAISIYLVGVLGVTNALLWPAIFPLALADLGRFTKTGSSFLVTGIVGGALLPLLFGYVADVASHQLAYLVCLPSYLFIGYFAAWGSKIRTARVAATPEIVTPL